MLKTYTSKPLTVEAVQLTEDNFADILVLLPVDVVLRFNWKRREITINNWLKVVKEVKVGDWIVKYQFINDGYDAFPDTTFKSLYI